MSEAQGSVIDQAPQPQAEAQPQGTPDAGAWYGDVPEDTRGFIEKRGWRNTGAVVDSFRSLEKMIGVPQDQLIRMPKSDAAPEEWAAVYDKLGRPKSAEEYGITAPEGVDPTFAKSAAAWMHEEGLTKAQATRIAAKYNEFVATSTAAQLAAMEQQTASAITEAESKLHSEWGAAFDERVEAGKRAEKEFGLTPEQSASIAKAIGYVEHAKLLASIGSRLMEGSAIGMGGGGSSFARTPAQAKAEMYTLQNDPEFGAKLARGDAGAIATWSKLQRDITAGMNG